MFPRMALVLIFVMNVRLPPTASDFRQRRLERSDDGALMCVQIRVQTGAHRGASSIRTARCTTDPMESGQKPKYERPQPIHHVNQPA